MFEVFEIAVPELTPGGRALFQPVQTAFGPTADDYLYRNGREFARVFKADAYTNPEFWTGGRGREDWTILSARSAAWVAGDDDGAWSNLVDTVRLVLDAHTTWVVICESLRDLHPFEERELTSAALVHLLDEYRATANTRVALRAHCAPQPRSGPR